LDSEEKKHQALHNLPQANIESHYEKELVRLLYSGNEDIVNHILNRVSPERILNNRYRKLTEIVLEGLNENKISPAYLIDKIPDEELRNFILDLTLSDETISKKWDELSYNGKIEKDSFEHSAEVVRMFLKNQIDLEIKRNNQLIAESKDEMLYIELMKRNKELQEEIKSLMGSKGKLENE